MKEFRWNDAAPGLNRAGLDDHLSANCCAYSSHSVGALRSLKLDDNHLSVKCHAHTLITSTLFGAPKHGSLEGSLISIKSLAPLSKGTSQITVDGKLKNHPVPDADGTDSLQKIIGLKMGIFQWQDSVRRNQVGVGLAAWRWKVCQ